MSEYPRPLSDIKNQQTPTTDTTVEELRLFVQRIKARWPDLCDNCKTVLRETLD